MTTNVKVFRSSDAGSPPAIAQAAGQLIAVLDGILINGYNSKTITVTRTGSIAIVACNAHGYTSGQCLLVSGADQAEYNGEKYITVTGDNEFTFPVSGTPESPATGVITSKVAPAGWTKPFEGTNKAAYRMGGGNQRYMRVDDTAAANTARFRGFEAMTSVDAGTYLFPTETQFAGGLYAQKSSSTVARDWMAVATDRHLYFFINAAGSSNGTYHCLWFFGDIKSRLVGDQYCTAIIAPTSSNTTQDNIMQQTAGNGSGLTGHYMSRSYTGVGGSLQISKAAVEDFQGGGFGNGGIPFPNPIDGSMLLSPVSVFDPGVCLRGSLPGLWAPAHIRPMAPFDVVQGTGELAGKTFMSVYSNYSGVSYMALLETSNTWDI